MQNVYHGPLSLKIKGIYNLTRFLPTVTWGISAGIIGLAFALPETRDRGVDWLSFFLVILNIILFHGVASHAINDIEDWRSGTDKLSPGVYSGGSKVIKNNFLTPDQMVKIALVSLLIGHIITAYLTIKFGIIILLFLMIALWASIAYTQPPLRLSYKPLLGEWLTGFPSVAAVTFLTFYILTGHLTLVVGLAGIAHGVLAIALLMFHHISDIKSDLQATPPKITTVAYISDKFGLKYSGLVAALYFILTVIIGLVGSIFNPILLISAIIALPCVGLSLSADAGKISDITRKESYIFALVIGHALAYLLVLKIYW